MKVPRSTVETQRTRVMGRNGVLSAPSFPFFTSSWPLPIYVTSAYFFSCSKNAKHATRWGRGSRGGDATKAESSFGASASNQYSVLHPMPLDASCGLRMLKISSLKLFGRFLCFFYSTYQSLSAAFLPCSPFC